MAVGHHWVPEAVRKALAKSLSSDAIDVFMRSVTGDPHNVYHNGKSQNNVSHITYNQLVKEKLEARIAELKQQGKLVRGKMTATQAQDFVKQIKKNGLEDRRIADFNRGVIKTLRLPVLGGIVATGLAQTVKAQKLADAVQRSGHYKRALDALQKGEWRKANAEIQGGFPVSDNNLVQDLINSGYAREAMILQRRWQQRENDFIKIEHGQSVPGVPDDF